MTTPQHSLESRPVFGRSFFSVMCMVLVSGCSLGSSVNDQGNPVQIFDLCIGITPPASMYLPLPEPPTDTHAVDVTVADVQDTTVRQPNDVGSVIDAQILDASDAGEVPAGEDTLTAGDGGSTSEDSNTLPADADEATFAAEVTELSDSVATTDTTDIEVADDSGDSQTSNDTATVINPDTLDGQNSETADSSEPGGLLPPIDTCVIAPGTCIGKAAPEWALFDFQPQSCGYQATYGLKQFVSHVTVVVLLASW